MTLLMFNQMDDGVIIITDTLTTTPEHVPTSFQTKVWTMPHADLAFAVTGTAGIGHEWHRFLTGLDGVWDIDTLGSIAPGVLQDIHAKLTDAYGDIKTSTVYMFGFPTGSDTMVRYVCRSTTDYNSEKGEGWAFAAKPAPDGFEEYDEPSTVEEMVALAERIRRDNDQQMEAGEGGVPIGGELFVTRVSKYNIGTARIHQFADYDEMHQQMFRRANELQQQEMANDSQ